MLVTFLCRCYCTKHLLGCKDVGCKPYCSDVIEHKVGRDVILPIASALMLCAIILLSCY